MGTQPHVWRFFRAGGLDQARVETSEDLLNLGALDQKLWVALSCPTKGLEFDARTLELVDTDKDGRIRAPELIAAVKWATGLLANPASLLKGDDGLALAAISEVTDEGKAIRASAARMLEQLGRTAAATITVAEASDTKKLYASTPFNGDGIVPAASVPEGPARKVLGEILETVGAETDRGGEPGVSKAKVDAFFAELAAFDAWATEGEKLAAASSPFGSDFAGAYAAFCAVKAKVDDWFARSRIAAFDLRAAGPLARSEADYAAIAAKDLSAGAAEIASLPLQRLGGTELDLAAAVNPAWAGAIAALRAKVVAPALGAGRTSISEDEWTSLKAHFAAHEAWLAGKQGGAVEKLGAARAREILGGSTKSELEAAIEKDLALAPAFADVEKVERLVRYHRDLHRLIGTMVNFAGFYDRRAPAIFQAGTLYLDQRSCDLCIPVTDVGAHAAVASLGRMYIAYCACTRPTGEKLTIAAAFTQGDSDYLMVGRNGVFYDRKGRDWDATITKVIDNPISIRQAFWSPYKKLARFVEAQIEGFAASKDKSVEDAAKANITEAAAGAEKGAAAKKEAFDVARFAGIFAAIGLAIGAIGGAIGSMVAAFASLAIWQMPLALLGILLAVSGPSMLLAWLKLRQRTLGPLLEGNGWAINGRIRVNLPLGTSLTAPVKLPANAERSLEDPFEDKVARRRTRLAWASATLVAVALVLWFVVKPIAWPEAPATPQPPPPATATTTP